MFTGHRTPRSKILPDRFRGMTPEQLEAIRRAQAGQAELNKELRSAERSHDEVGGSRRHSLPAARLEKVARSL